MHGEGRAGFMQIQPSRVVLLKGVSGCQLLRDNYITVFVTCQVTFSIFFKKTLEIQEKMCYNIGDKRKL